MIFVGLDDNTWWSFKNDATEATAGFFVAFTRARQRVIFTHYATANRTLIAPLYALLGAAGVKTVAKALSEGGSSHLSEIRGTFRTNDLKA